MKAVRRLTDGLQATGCFSAHEKNRVCLNASVSSETVSPQPPRAKGRKSARYSVPSLPFAGCGCRAALDPTYACKSILPEPAEAEKRAHTGEFFSPPHGAAPG